MARVRRECIPNFCRNYPRWEHKGEWRCKDHKHPLAVYQVPEPLPDIEVVEETVQVKVVELSGRVRGSN